MTTSKYSVVFVYRY